MRFPGHVGDVEQAVDAAQVDERAVLDEVLDHALEHDAFLQVGQQAVTLGAVLGFEHFATADDDVVAQAIELDDLELERLAFQIRRIANRANVDERTGEEGADGADVDREAALDLAGDDADDGLFALEGLREALPGLDAFGLFLAELGFAEAVFDGFQRHFHFVADIEVQLAIDEELCDRDHAFGLQARVDDDDVGFQLQHDGTDDGARLHGLAAGQAGFKKFSKRFAHGVSVILPATEKGSQSNYRRPPPLVAQALQYRFTKLESSRRNASEQTTILD